jgi:hypothetical protein
MKLKEGDRIYRCYQGTPTSIMVIERTTKTQAVCGTTKFRREYSENSWVNMIGAGSYSLTSYYLETPKLIERYNRVKLLSEVGRIKFENLSNEQLRGIINVL